MPIKYDKILGKVREKDSGVVEVYDEGILVGAASIIDIIGVNHNAALISAGRVAIYSPSAVFSPKYNAGGAAVPSIAVSNRNVADPLGTYDIDTWVAGSVHGCSIAGNPSWATGAVCSFDNLLTTFEVKVFGADGVTVLATHLTAAITGNVVLTVANITITISSWAVEFTKYRAVITVAINMSAILPAGGRYSVSLVHHNNGTDYSKIQNDIFYDVNPNAATVNTPTIIEGGSVITKDLSGLPFYILGSQFQIDISDIDYVNANSYLDASLVDVEGAEYGLPALLLGSGDLTGWGNLWNDQNDTYQKTNWAITAANFRAISTLANINARAKDWADQAYQPSANAAVLIDTWLQQSNDLSEYFTDEVYRRTVADAAFDSSQSLVTYDGTVHAQVIGGILRVPNVDYSIYKPTNTRDYTGLATCKNYYRRIIDASGLVRAGCSLTIAGFTLANLVASDVEMWLLIPSKWVSWCYAHTALTFNFGTFDGDNDPIRLLSSIANRIDVSFGTLGLDAVNTFFRLRIVINNAAITPDSIVVSW